MNENTRAHLAKTGAVGLLLLDIVLARRFFFKSLGRAAAANLTVWLLLHVPQIPKALKECRSAGIPDGRIAAQTALWGAAWWKPASKGVID